MDSIGITTTLETRVSKKGSPYQVLVIRLTPTYEKLVFLDKAEQELLNLKRDTFLDYE